MSQRILGWRVLLHKLLSKTFFTLGWAPKVNPFTGFKTVDRADLADHYKQCQTHISPLKNLVLGEQWQKLDQSDFDGNM